MSVRLRDGNVRRVRQYNSCTRIALEPRLRAGALRWLSLGLPPPG